MARPLTLFDRCLLAGTGSAAATGRSQPVELLRILSAYGIVAFHARAGLVGQIGYAGLVVFLFLMAYYESRSGASGLRGLATRFLLPWGTWYVIFAIVAAVKGYWPADNGTSLLSIVLFGPSPHLWFLPFAFLVLAVLRLTKVRIGSGVTGATASILCLVLLLTSPLWLHWFMASPHPVPEYVFGLIPVLLGVAAGRSPRIGWLAVLASIAVALFFLVTRGWFNGLVYVIGLSAVAAAIGVGTLIPNWRWSPQAISRYMFGVYLSHPLFLTVFGHVSLPPLVKAVVAFSASLGFVWLLSALDPWMTGRLRAFRPRGRTPSATVEIAAGERC